MNEFQRNAAKYVKELPFVLTRYGKAVAKVVKVKRKTNKIKKLQRRLRGFRFK
jgi:hypothetical protein